MEIRATNLLLNIEANVPEKGANLIFRKFRLKLTSRNHLFSTHFASKFPVAKVQEK